MAIRNPDIVAVRLNDPLQSQVIRHDTQFFNPVADFARTLMLNLSIPVVYRLEGDGISFRALSEDEVVERACTIAEKAFAEFEKRGWVIEGPRLQELMPETKQTVGFK